MPFTFNAVELCFVTINENPWIRAREVCSALEYDTKTSWGPTAAQKISLKSIKPKWAVYMLHLHRSIGHRIRKNTIFTPMRVGFFLKGMSCYFQANSQRQKTSKDTAAMCCFLIFDSSLVISYMRWKLKILQTVSRPLRLRMKKNARPINRKFWGLMKSTDKPLKKKM